jgi:hypothetical protein
MRSDFRVTKVTARVLIPHFGHALRADAAAVLDQGTRWLFALAALHAAGLALGFVLIVLVAAI